VLRVVAGGPRATIGLPRAARPVVATGNLSGSRFVQRAAGAPRPACHRTDRRQPERPVGKGISASRDRLGCVV